VLDTKTEPICDRTPRHDVRYFGGTSQTATVVAMVVTWNRKDMVASVIDALVAQARACHALHVVVVDNASTDGTTEYLTKKFCPEQVVSNDTTGALKPEFTSVYKNECSENIPGFASLIVVQNTNNLGGCGGFNTGFKYVEHAFGKSGSSDAPDFVWLLDDDIDLPAEALSELLDAAMLDQEISLVGSRTVDLGDRQTTIESTIFFDATTGLMGPEPDSTNPLAKEHNSWVSSARDEHGNPIYSGVRDVDIVSACSMLARWKDVCEVGYWDDRFFIYCDDADWCLRFKSKGKRVICALDAIVFHTPWSHKLTPERGYYLNRNLAWVIRRNIDGSGLRMTLFKWSARLMSQAKTAILNRRLYEADLIMRAVADSISGNGGKLVIPSADTSSAVEALIKCNAIGRGKRVVLSCHTHESTLKAERFRCSVANELIDTGRAADQPTWIVLAEDGAALPQHGGESSVSGAHRPELREYFHDRFNKIDAQLDWFRSPPAALVVFDSGCEFPLLRCPNTIHIQSNDTESARIERDGIRVKLRYGMRWVVLGMRVVVSVARARPETQ
jgi:GT2 family glycosyltransferase